MKRIDVRWIALSLVTMFAVAAAAQDSKRNNTDKNRVILKGYDTVSYFTSSKPLPGDAKITTEYQGAVYRFANEENRTKFLAEPQKYRPEYGGWCAKAIADKDFVDIDPLNLTAGSSSFTRVCSAMR
jgi:YHS domain-containing protein